MTTTEASHGAPPPPKHEPGTTAWACEMARALFPDDLGDGLAHGVFVGADGGVSLLAFTLDVHERDRLRHTSRLCREQGGARAFVFNEAWRVRPGDDPATYPARYADDPRAQEVLVVGSFTLPERLYRSVATAIIARSDTARTLGPWMLHEPAGEAP